MLTKELIGQVAAEAGISKKQAEQLLSTTNAIVRDNLMVGKTIQLQGLGWLEVKERNERIIVHPKTGERTLVPRKHQLAFRPVAPLKEELKNVGHDK